MTDKLRQAAQQAHQVLENFDELKTEITAAPQPPADPEPLNLNCKSTQKRLATMWGFVPSEPSQRSET